ncbi:peptide synthase [Opitutaceae bacterium TAV5]|nr:peptide synthase [Opitutaceae bacterium TAV5]
MSAFSVPASPDIASPNIARHLDRMAAHQPDQPALKVPRGVSADGRIDYLVLSFAELAAEVQAWGERLRHQGVVRGDRVLVMVRPGLPLIASVFALFRAGAVPVVIDPGMGRKAFLAAVARSQPRVLLGIPTARLASRIFRRAFRSVKIRVPASGRMTARLATGAGGGGGEASPCAAVSADETAAILFTSGSTGAPKGVVYTHGMFAAQVELVRNTYGIAPGEVDLPFLPVFALFNPALGTTTVVPEVDPSKPATFDPARAVQAIRQEGVTYSFGSPTLWGKIARHCLETGQTLPSVRRVLCAGAPVPPWLWEAMRTVLPNGTLHSPYGATEVLPVASIEGREVTGGGTARATLAGAGTCAGRVLPGNRVKIIALTDAPLASLDDARELPAGEVGEIIVSGPTVTLRYDALPEATAAAKIRELPAAVAGAAADPRAGAATAGGAGESGAEVIWHRMGDCGYLDGEGRLWFCGRKAERVETEAGTLFTEQVEPVFAAHPEVRRCALIGLGANGRKRPAIVVELAPGCVVESGTDGRRLARELRALGQEHPHTAAIKVFYFHQKFPVDVRHNAKIHRLALAAWAQNGAIGFESDPKR